MKIHIFILPILCMGLFQAGSIRAQEPASAKQDTDIQLLKKQMLEMQASIQQMQAQHQQEIEALKAQIEEQQKIITDVQKFAGAAPLPAKGGESPPGAPLFPTTDESVVAGTPPPALPGTATFPTTDASVTGGAALAGSKPSSSLTAPITL